MALLPWRCGTSVGGRCVSVGVGVGRGWGACSAWVFHFALACFELYQHWETLPKVSEPSCGDIGDLEVQYSLYMTGCRLLLAWKQFYLKCQSVIFQHERTCAPKGEYMSLLSLWYMISPWLLKGESAERGLYKNHSTFFPFLCTL